MRRHVKRIELPVICVASLLVISILICALHAGPATPARDPSHDLLGCTRLEIGLAPSIIDYFHLDDERRVLLTREEDEHLKSLGTIICDNPEYIRAFATSILDAACYIGPAKGMDRIATRIYVAGYHNSERVTSLTITGNTVLTEDGHEFKYGAGLRQHLHLILSEVWPFALRAACANNLSELRSYLRGIGNGKVYPTPARWCDAVSRNEQEPGPDPSYERSVFECPSAHTCHYAINPDCKPDSSADVVLLFETKLGWNQHGGPELFSFDNHDPKGGCVLLSDGTVKFIRTEEELKQLRWK